MATLRKWHLPEDLKEARREPCRYLREEHPGRGNSLCRGPEAEAWLLWLRSKGRVAGAE